MTLRAIEPVERPERQQFMIDNVIDMATDESGLIGYVVVALYADGKARSLIHRPNAEDHQVGASLFNAWVEAELAANHSYAVANEAIEDAIDGET